MKKTNLAEQIQVLSHSSKIHMLLHMINPEITRLGGKKKKRSKSQNQFSALRSSQGSWQSFSKIKNLKHPTYYHTPVEVPLL